MVEKRIQCVTCISVVSMLESYIKMSMRPCLQLVLLVIFLHYFGLPAVSRYQKMEVMVVSSRRDTGGIQAPAITIAAGNPHGWRDNVTDLPRIEQKCKSRANNQTVTSLHNNFGARCNNEQCQLRTDLGTR